MPLAEEKKEQARKITSMSYGRIMKLEKNVEGNQVQRKINGKRRSAVAIFRSLG